MPIVLVIDDTISLYQKVYETEATENMKQAAYHYVRLLCGSFKYPYNQYVALYQRLTNGLSLFCKDPKMLLDEVKSSMNYDLENPQGDIRYADISKLCDKELTKTWGCSTVNHIIIVTDGGKREFMIDESEIIEIDDDFRSVVHVVSCGFHINSQLKSISDLTGGVAICGKSEWRKQLSAEEAASKLFVQFRDCVKQLWPSSATIEQGHFSMTTNIFPFVNLHYYEQINNRESNKKYISCNLHISIIGFISLVDLNYPCCSSDHILIHDSEDSPDTQSSVYYAQLLNNGLLNTKSAAICTIKYVNDNTDYSRYGFIRNIAVSENRHTLKLCLFPKDYVGLPWLGKFENFIPYSDLQDGESRNPFPIKLADNCSYKSNSTDTYQYTTWVCSPNTVVNDFYKIIRISKRLPDRRAVFYKEINRFKETALSIGSPVLVNSLCRLLEKEMANMTNQEALDIIRHVVETVTSSPCLMLVDKQT